LVPRWSVVLYVKGTAAEVADRLWIISHLEPVVRDGSAGLVFIKVTVAELDENAAADYAKWAVERELRLLARVESVKAVPK